MTNFKSNLAFPLWVALNYLEEIGERLSELLEAYSEKGFQKGVWGSATMRPGVFMWRALYPEGHRGIIGVDYSAEMGAIGVWDSRAGGRRKARATSDLEVAIAYFEIALEEAIKRVE